MLFNVHILFLVFEEVLPEDSGVYVCQCDYGGLEPLVTAVYALAGMYSPNSTELQWRISQIIAHFLCVH